MECSLFPLARTLVGDPDSDGIEVDGTPSVASVPMGAGLSGGPVYNLARMASPDPLDYQPRLKPRPSPRRDFIFAVGFMLAALAIIFTLGVVAFFYAALGPR